MSGPHPAERSEDSTHDVDAHRHPRPRRVAAPRLHTPDRNKPQRAVERRVRDVARREPRRAALRVRLRAPSSAVFRSRLSQKRAGEGEGAHEVGDDAHERARISPSLARRVRREAAALEHGAHARGADGRGERGAHLRGERRLALQHRPR